MGRPTGQTGDDQPTYLTPAARPTQWQQHTGSQVWNRLQEGPHGSGPKKGGIHASMFSNHRGAE